ncbi:unnamed protein product [Ceutorhynchus assimilis]|uniref:Uncharacterized protein n=1 Tax=Ceutorhynchus assimilis TaxID=467358 RepID=A0A9N9ML41_9CUCU|nr:unnamed protein product [Ceutorhynchus assimilis]
MRYLIGSFLLASMALIATSSPTSLTSGATIIAPDEPGTLIKGPTSKATVKGPSGPLIVAVGDTGAVISARINGGIVSASAESSGSVVLPVAPIAVPLEPVALGSLHINAGY